MQTNIDFSQFVSQTYPLSSMDRWICSRLYSTVQQCERGFESFELHTVTSALHSFWLHSLCDVYLVSMICTAVLSWFDGSSSHWLMSFLPKLAFSVPLWLLQESIKPVLKREGSDSEEQRVRERQVATSVLYHSVSISLALLSPFMPFLTEEMWQRLLPYGDSDRTSTSLCVQPYPKTSQLVSQSETHKHYSCSLLDNIMQFSFCHKQTLFNLLFHRSTGIFLRRKQTSLWYRKLSEWRGYWGLSARWQRKDLTVRKS